MKPEWALARYTPAYRLTEGGCGSSGKPTMQAISDAVIRRPERVTIERLVGVPYLKGEAHEYISKSIRHAPSCYNYAARRYAFE